MLPVKFTVPVFLFMQLLSAFLRNDSNPGLATKAVVLGGVFNVVGDYLLVFTFDMGILGAGIATVCGACLSLILSTNFGAQKLDRIRLLVRYNLISVAVVSGFWFALTMAVPKAFVHLFMSPTESVLQVAPAIIRTYCVSFLILPLNIYSTYYFQSVMKPVTSFSISIARGMVISGALIIFLPILFGGYALWAAMPMTEFIVAVFVVYSMIKSVKRHPIMNQMKGDL